MIYIVCTESTSIDFVCELSAELNLFNSENIVFQGGDIVFTCVEFVASL